MQIHELNNYNGDLDSAAFLAVDNGSDTGKVSTTELLADINAAVSQLDTFLNGRIDNIIAGGEAPSASEIVDARYGADGVTYPSLGDAIRDQITGLKNDLNAHDAILFKTNAFNSKTVLFATTNAYVNNGDGTYNITTGDYGTIIFGDEILLPAGTYQLYGVPNGIAFLSTTTNLADAFVQNNGVSPIIVTIATDTNCYLGYRINAEPTESFVIAPFLKQAITVDENERFETIETDLTKLYVPSVNLYNPSTDRHGKNLDGNSVVDDSDFKLSDYIYVGAKNYVCVPFIAGLNGVLKINFYTDNNESGYSRSLYVTSNPSEAFQLAVTEQYVVLTMYDTSEPFMVNIGQTLLPFAPYGGSSGAFLQEVINDINDDVESRTNAIKDSSAQKNIVNRFDKATISEGFFVNPSTGGLASNSNFFASDYIDVSDLSEVMCSYTHIVCFYDSSKTFISGQGFDTISADASISRPSNAKYFRFSTYNENLDYAQIGESVSRSNYVPFGKYTLPDFLASATEKIVVDASGGGDYTSFTRAIYETVDSGVDVFVKAGTYDIVSEYVDLFGQTAVNGMADADDSVFNGFQYGVVLRNRKVEFASGAHLVCDWTGHTVDGTHRFSALRVDYNAEIIGLDLVSAHTFYAIHDDYGLWDEPYTVKYENCRVKGVNLTNANCIGGGCKPYSRHIINNCYFDNGLNDVVVRYHNTNATGAEPEVYVSNSFFNSVLSFNYYGSQSTKMKAYVNNCKAKAIHKEQESSSFSVDNVELYKWCCEETA